MWVSVILIFQWDSIMCAHCYKLVPVLVRRHKNYKNHKDIKLQKQSPYWGDHKNSENYYTGPWAILIGSDYSVMTSLVMADYYVDQIIEAVKEPDNRNRCKNGPEVLSYQPEVMAIS